MMRDRILLLACAIVMACLHIHAGDYFEYSFDGQKYTFQVIDGTSTCMLTTSSSGKYNTTASGTIVLPQHAIYNNQSYKVEGIGSNAFRTNTKLQRVTIPEGYKYINSAAFPAAPTWSMSTSPRPWRRLARWPSTPATTSPL